MRAVNLIPADVQRAGARSLRLAPATYGLFGALAVALALMTLYVLDGNTVASRQAQLASLQNQLHAAQTEATELSPFTQYAALAQSRLSTVRGIAATRFDWNLALHNLARVIPANTSLTSLNATVVPGASSGGSGGSAGGLRGARPGPAFEMVGCTHTQVEVARLISRLRAMPDVTRVALTSSAISGSGGGATSTTAGRGCPSTAPVFNLTVFFQPVAGAGANGVTSLPSSTGTTTAPGGAQ